MAGHFELVPKMLATKECIQLHTSVTDCNNQIFSLASVNVVIQNRLGKGVAFDIRVDMGCVFNALFLTAFSL